MYRFEGKNGWHYWLAGFIKGCGEEGGRWRRKVFMGKLVDHSSSSTIVLSAVGESKVAMSRGRKRECVWCRVSKRRREKGK